MARDTLTHLPRRPKRRDPISARGQREVIGAIEQLARTVGPPRQRDPLGDPRLIAMFKLVSVQGDYLMCRRWLPDTSEFSTIEEPVAKGYLLRGTLASRGIYSFTYDDPDTALERESDDSSTTETQVVVPDYVVEDLIYAVRVSGGTGVEADGAFVEWLEISPRAWAQKNE